MNGKRRRTDMADISVDLLGLKLKSPVMLGSCAMCNSGEKIKKFALEGEPAAVVTKSISVDMGQKWGRGSKQPSPRNIWPNPNTCVCVEKGEPTTCEDWFYKEIPLALQGNVPVVASISGSTIFAELYYVATELEKAGVSMVELNFGTGHSGDFSHGKICLDIGVGPTLVSKLKKVIKIPIVVKFPYYYTPETIKIAKEIEAAGADGILALNGPQVTAVDPEVGRIPLGAGHRAGALNGPALKPMALRMVKDIALNVKIPIIGVGGVTSGLDVIEFIMVGATCVQVASGAIVRGPGIFKKINGEIREFMERKGYENLSQIRGMALKDLGYENFAPHTAVVNEKLCNGCGTCEVICTSIVPRLPAAMRLNKERKVAEMVDAAKCEGCGWCVSRCPKAAIKLKGWSI
jgi:dihydroorotate dehydrogenase subfamily 1